MRAFWNKQSKSRKIIACALAVCLALVPLVSYIGPKKGAKAADDTYTFALGETGLVFDREAGHVVLEDAAGAKKTFSVPGGLLGEEEASWSYGFSGSFKDADGSLAAEGVTISGPDFYLVSGGEFSLGEDGTVVNGTQLTDKVKLMDGSVVKAVIRTERPAPAPETEEEAPEEEGGEPTEPAEPEEPQPPIITWLAPITITVRQATEIGAPVWTSESGAIDETAYYGPTQVSLDGVTYSGIGSVKYAYGTVEGAALDSDISGWTDSKSVQPGESEDGWYGYAGVFVEDTLVMLRQTEKRVRIDATAPSELTWELQDPSASGVKVVDNVIYYPKEALPPALALKLTDDRNADGRLNAASGTVTKGELSEDKTSCSYTFSPADYTEDTEVSFTGTDAAGNLSDQVTVVYSPVDRDIHFVGKPILEAPATDGSYTNQNGHLTFVLESGYQFGEYSVKGKASGGKPAYESGALNLGNGVLGDNGNYRVTVEASIPSAGGEETTFAVKDLTISASDAKNTVTKDVEADYIYDTTVPGIRNCKLQVKEDEAWTDVTAKQVASDGGYYVLEPSQVPGDYRYYFEASDSAGNLDESSFAATYNGEAQTVERIGTGKYVSYVVPAVDQPENFRVSVKDTAGNISEECEGNFVIIGVDNILRVQRVRITSPAGVKLADLSSETGAISGVPYEFTITATSGYEVKDIRITGDNDALFVSSDLENRTPEGSDDAHKWRNTFVGTITIPAAELKKNHALTNLKVVVTDEEDQTAEKTLGSLLYDQTKPVIRSDGKELSEDAKWYQSFRLNVEITPGDMADPNQPESEIASAKYSITNSTNDHSEDMTIKDGKVSSSIKIPQSTGVDGTKITFDAQDKAGNKLMEPNVSVIRVDSAKPKVASIAINGESEIAAKSAFKGNMNVSLSLQDNLTLKSVKLWMVSEDGEEKQVLSDSVKRDKANNSDKVTATVSAKINTKKFKDGKWQLKAVAEDKAGNESVPKLVTFIVDNKAPVLSAIVVSGKNDGKEPIKQSDGSIRDYYYRSDVRMQFTCDDSNIVTGNISVSDNGEPISLKWKKNEAGVYEADVNIKADGEHSIWMDAVDNAGNEAAPKDLYFLIDRETPVVSEVAFGGIAAESIVNPFKSEVELQAKLSDNKTLGDVTVFVTNPEGDTYEAFAKNINLEEDDVTSTLTLKLTTKKKNENLYDGKWTVKLSVKDLSGNKINAGSYSFMVDNTVPVVSAKVISGVGGGKRPVKNFDNTDYDYYNRSDVGVELTCLDDNLDTVTVQDNGTTVNDLSWAPREDGTLVAGYLCSGDGVHTVTIDAVDKTGNKAEQAVLQFVRDTGLPTVGVNINGGTIYQESMGPVDITGDAGIRTSVTDMTVDPDNLNFRAIVKKPDQAETVAAAKTQANRSFDFTEEADYNLELFAIDMAGNRGPTRNVAFRIDKTAPVVNISGTESSAGPIDVTFSLQEAFYWDMRDVRITINRTVGEGGTVPGATLTPTGANSTTSVRLTDTGRYEVTFSATDRAGHTAETSKIFIIDADAPKLTMQASYTNKEKKSVKLANYEAAKDDSPVEFYVSVDEVFFDRQTAKLSGWVQDIEGEKSDLSFEGFQPNSKRLTEFTEEFKEDGIYHIELTAEDEAGNKSSEEINFTIDTKAPIIGSLDKYKGNEDGYRTEFLWDENMDTLVKDLTVCDSHVYLNGKEYDGTSDLEDGAYKLQVLATDELGHESRSDEIQFTLDTVAPEFIVTGVEDGQAKEEAYNITVSLQLDEDTLTGVSLNGQDIAISGNTATLTVSEKGDYKLAMEAVDKAGHVSSEMISFTFGKKLKLLPFIIGGGAALLLAGIIIIVAVKRKKNA